MPEPELRSERLSTHHPREDFGCGVDTLDRYLRQQATQDLRRGLAVPYVLVDSATGLIAGYYTLSSFAIDANELPEGESKHVGRYPAVPTVLIGRLARDVRYRGQGIGELLVTDACQRVLSLAQDLGVWAIVVDAKDDASRDFYEGFGFTRSVDSDRRLIMALRTIVRLLGRSTSLPPQSR